VSEKPAAEAPGARPNWLQRLAQEHARVALYTLGRLWREPGASLLTALAIGITLALPAALHVLLQNVNAVSYSWESALQASLFLKDSVDADSGRTLARDIGKRPGVARATYISREQSLAEFKELSGFGEALDLLEDNPLPAVIVVTPQRDLPRATLDRLIDDLSRLKEVEVAKLDRKWLDRLYALLAIVERVVLLIAAVLAMAVIVTVGNTIRLHIENRREEIVVMKLIGAPDSFIRRPFLYTGFWYGLAGGLVAWALMHAAVLALAGPTRSLAGLYESSFSLIGLSPRDTLILLGAGVLLGVIGSAWTVGRHLSEYEPA